eukprot:4171380-Amphidinium_carterae.2
MITAKAGERERLVSKMGRVSVECKQALGLTSIAIVYDALNFMERLSKDDWRTLTEVEPRNDLYAGD